jgi:hypothetical protein
MADSVIRSAKSAALGTGFSSIIAFHRRRAKTTTTKITSARTPVTNRISGQLTSIVASWIKTSPMATHRFQLCNGPRGLG